MATFAPGATTQPTNWNFVSSYEAHMPDNESKLVKRWGDNLSGFLDFVGAKKGTSSLEFSRWEEDRLMPKIYATTAGAGAGATCTFTIHASDKITAASASPYDTGATTDEVTASMRVNDLIMIKPSTGTVSNGSYIKSIVTSVTGSTSFAATPIVSTEVTPAIATAQEIVVYGNAHGEMSGFQAPMSTKATKYTENLQTIKHLLRVSGREALAKKWFDDESGNRKFAVKGEANAYAQFLNLQDLNLLVGEKLSNTALATVFQTARTPLSLTRGLLSTILDGGNVLNYASVSGLTVADLYDYNIEIDSQNASKKNLMFTGIALDQDIDIELGDRLKDGAISYGNFSGSQEKAVDLSFQKFTLGNYTYDKRAMDSFNDVQTLGADGFGFKYEFFTIPSGLTKVAGGAEKGSMVATLRKRFMEGEGKSRELDIDYFNARTMSTEGYDYEEVRYQADVALEAMAINQYGYGKRA